jgi:uncharacterized membrane protein
MNAAHLHLIVNHGPIFLTFAGILTALWGYRRSDDAWFIAFVLWVMSGASAGIAYASGGGAADAIKDLPGVSASAVEPHEDVAKVALILAIVLGLLSIVAIVARALRRSPPLRAIAFAFAVITLGAMGYVANLGGDIHHQEISLGR